jgi:hypothetical protein
MGCLRNGTEGVKVGNDRGSVKLVLGTGLGWNGRMDKESDVCVITRL